MFEQLRPSFCTSPHLIVPAGMHLVEAIVLSTGRYPGAWPLLPYYSDEGEFEIAEYPFSMWRNSYNQEKLKDYCSGGGEWDCIVDSSLPRDYLRRLFPPELFDSCEGRWPAIHSLIEEVPWLALPAPDSVHLMALVCVAKEVGLVNSLKECLARLGVECSQISIKEGTTEIVGGFLSEMHIEPLTLATIQEIANGNLDIATWPVVRGF